MRRKNANLTYKNRTASIVADHFETWQLTRRDPRDGIHRLINTTVSMIEELDSETAYIEQMFMPDAMDLAEPWVMYQSYPFNALADLYVSGQLASDILTVATSIDEFLFGDIDFLSPEFTISGIPYTKSILSTGIDQIYLLGSGTLAEYNLQTQEFVRSGQIDVTYTAMKMFYADVEHPVYTMKENFREETLQVTLSGVPVSYTLQMASDMTGTWVGEFDVNYDGYIGEYERDAVSSALGITQQQVSPSVWPLYDWMDVNKDGAISESDYNAILLSVPSVAPDITAVVKVPRSVAGAVSIVYEIELPRTEHLYRGSSPFSKLTDLDKLYEFSSKVAYDNVSDIYYGINADGTQLRAYRYDPQNDEVVSDILVHVERWSHDCLLIDLDTYDGFLFVLAGDGTTNKMFYGDIWGETTWEIPTEVEIPSLSGELPTAMTATQDGYFVVAIGDTLRVFSQGRDKAIDVGGIGYFNNRHSLALEDATALKTIPSYIFNAFDSFAYSAMGLSRPLGCDNLQMRKLIMDFWQHPQGNDKLGMNFGLMREFGYENDDTVVSGLVYSIPAELTYSGESVWDVYVNGYAMDVSEIASGEVLLSGEIGSIRVLSGIELIPDEQITEDYNYLRIEGYFLDGNEDPMRLVYTIPIDQGKVDPDIMVRTYGDSGFLTDVGYIISGEPVQELIDIVTEAESTNPFVYSNAMTNMIPMDSNRISVEPALATIYDVDISGLISELTEVEIDI